MLRFAVAPLAQLNQIPVYFNAVRCQFKSFSKTKTRFFIYSCTKWKKNSIKVKKLI